MRWNVHFECDISRGKWNNSIKGLKDAMRHNSQVYFLWYLIFVAAFDYRFLDPLKLQQRFRACQIPTTSSALNEEV